MDLELRTNLFKLNNCWRFHKTYSSANKNDFLTDISNNVKQNSESPIILVSLL